MLDVRYTKDHEWIRLDGDVGEVGITTYAQSQLGDVVYVELPAIGKRLGKGAEAAVVESGKAASEVYSPVGGEALAVNDALAGSAARQGRARSRADVAANGGTQHDGGLGAVLGRLRRLPAPHSGERRSSDSALRVPHFLHAISARDFPRHVAGVVRVPDPSRRADRHGSGQCFDVRRLDRGGRGGADGAPHHQAPQSGAGRKTSAPC